VGFLAARVPVRGELLEIVLSGAKKTPRLTEAGSRSGRSPMWAAPAQSLLKLEGA